MNTTPSTDSNQDAAWRSSATSSVPWLSLSKDGSLKTGQLALDQVSDDRFNSFVNEAAAAAPSR